MVQRNRLFHTTLLFFWLIGGSSCTSSDSTKPTLATTGSYFSLEDFFLKEANRLAKLAPTVDKTVSRNGAPENKRVQIDDWENELALFIASDINKPAWQNSYRADSTEGSLIYTSIDPELRTQKIIIDKHRNGNIKHIAISNSTGNMLYKTTEHLDYYPDSLYQINKQQQVRVIGDSQYSIRGILQ